VPFDEKFIEELERDLRSRKPFDAQAS